MRRILLLSIIIFVFTKSFSQPPATPLVPIYTGDTVIITGRIYAGNYLQHVTTMPTFLNVYDSSPMHMLMVRVDSGDRKNFPEAPEKYYLNKKVSIRGVLSDYKGVSLIKIVDPSVVEIDKSDKGPEPITSTGTYMSGHDFGFGKTDSLFRKSQDSIKTVLAADTSRPKREQAYKAQVKAIVRQNAANNVLTPQTRQEEKAAPEPIAPKEEPKPEIKPVPAPVLPQPAPVADTIIKERNPGITIIPETDTTIEEKADVVKEVKLKNLPVAKPVTNTNVIDTAAKSKYLKTISSQEFIPVNEIWNVRDGEIEMRTSPNIDAPVLAYLMKQMTIRITHKSKKWSYVTVENPDGTIGLSGFIKNRVYKDLDQKQ